MWSFFSKIFVFLFIVSALIIVIPNPIHQHFPRWIKGYVDFKDPEFNNLVEIEQLELMNQDPVKCYKNSDCILISCGEFPNCYSVAISQFYFETYPDNIPSSLQCPHESDPDPNDCGNTPIYDLHATCDQGSCTLRRLLPTPSASNNQGIIEKALYDSD